MTSSSSQLLQSLGGEPLDALRGSALPRKDTREEPLQETFPTREQVSECPPRAGPFLLLSRGWIEVVILL